jgi:hypothetical protein
MAILAPRTDNSSSARSMAVTVSNCTTDSVLRFWCSIISVKLRVSYPTMVVLTP